MIPSLNPSTLIPNEELNKPNEPIKTLKEVVKPPRSLVTIRKPLSLDKSLASSELESESESKDEIQEAEVIRLLIKKHVKIHANYLKATSDVDKKAVLDQAQQSQLILQKMIPNKEIESYVNGWNPWIEKKKIFPAPIKSKKRPKSDKRNQPRQSGSSRPDQPRSSNRQNQARSNIGRGQGHSNSNQRQTHSNNQGSNKRPREESEDLEDEVRWAKVHQATAVLRAFFCHTKR
ncbi:hypothetical protein H4Q26_005625 [Puccinia striiformis f. sp. tritici PST-130]|uniref:Uncharacterized protein n=1 Tax=Puccinia striiformis f. sp. tritici PST-78 TaxID=1165861 RepID=A0A0L0UX26_9BASI|nr:hypothetical protein H4Q26_005625 [Puccinia striiformis f. sp. tritici PST-130]KNE91466.1 hypothetical protein PSTG_15124 [Puccinia striiformis f. sp. tritici PST-78]